MCGIIAYKSNTETKPKVILEGLKKLEYRGYDSWGIATKKDNQIEVFKKTGEIGAIQDLTNSNLSIGHTRWATHGGVTDTNAHPHVSNDNKIAVVHNGIIENYQELKKKLQDYGFNFNSETDSEVIPNLIQMYMKQNSFEESVKKALEELQGSYAVAVINLDEDVLIGARRGSPLVLGVGEGEFFIASDIPAFMEHTKKVVYLHDYDFIKINKDFSIFNIKENKQVERPVQSITWNAEEVEKGNYEHFMMKEIEEQAETIQKAIHQNDQDILDIAEDIKNSYGVFFVACGSSYNACLSAKYVFSKIAGKPVNVVLASEFDQYENFLNDMTMVIAVSQSGETADVLDAVKLAKKHNSKVLALVNVIGSTLTREADSFLTINAGPEICVLSTKTYTSQLSLMMLIAHAVAGELEEGKQELKNLYNLVFNLTSANTREYIGKLAEKLKDKNHLFLIGRAFEYPTAMEAALKIKEVSYIHAEGWAGGELKHGSIALIEKDSPVIAFYSNETEKETISNAIETKARGAYLIGIGPTNNSELDFFIKVPDADELNSIIQIIPIQILSYQLAKLRGLNPDKPRNLAKSVTVK